MNIPALRQKAESGSVVAQSVLGICYLDGVDVAVDYSEAFRFLSAAAGAQESSVDACEELREAKAYLARRS